MKTEKCHFSGFKIYPGHGKKYVRIDCKAFTFIDSKSEATALRKVNPRKVKWTQIYRRVHKKGTTQEVKKKRTRRIVRVQRDIVGATRAEIKVKRKQRDEIRARAQAEALKEVKARQQKKAAGSGKGKGAKVQTGGKKAPAAKNVKSGKGR